MNNNYLKSFILFLIGLFFINATQAQLTQNIRGTVQDNLLQMPIKKATVTLISTNESTTTDSMGNFRFNNVAVGLQSISISHTSYKEAILSNLSVNSGKELVLTIPLESKIVKKDAITIKGDRKKNKPLNEMSAVSARAFTVEETQKYAASLNDPLRMATNFAGVVGVDDGNNNIVIRGNSPAGLLWKMEGVDIPNPNHFSNASGSGGGISILSSQLLANSDFITGAFAAEYGNATSGVFDLKLRKGNNEHKETSLQAGLLGLNVSVEGPFKKGYKGSYLVNYRYSTLGILSKTGLLPNISPTTFQDLSYNIYLPTKKAGTFTIFGFGGLSNQNSKYLNDSTKWKTESDRYGSIFISNTGVNAITHLIKLGELSTLKSTVSYAATTIETNEIYAKSLNNIQDNFKENNTTKKFNFSTTLNHKFNSQSTLRTGIIYNNINYNFFQKSKENNNDPLRLVLDAKGKTNTIQGFAQWQYKTTNNVTLNAGLHTLYLTLNKKIAIEPRASVKWDITNRQSLSFGYGLHSQVQALGVYFAQVKDVNNNITIPNKNLDFTKAHHYVLSHQILLDRNLRLRTELYYQQLSKVPVSNSDTNTFSTVNIIDNFITDPLLNQGTGKNYGLDISLEKYLSNKFYYMFSNSFYQSKYTAKDGIERNTRFNGGYVSNLIAGKDFVSKNERRTFGVNVKVVYAGGFRETPIDIAKSQALGYASYTQKDAFSVQNSPYQRTDLRLSMKWNRKHTTSTLSLDLQNLANRKNVFGNFYDPLKQNITTINQNGLIPVLNYKIEF
jgi:hypothetical protein